MEGALLRRVITAAILAPVVVAGILFLPVPWFAGLIGVFVCLGAKEWGYLAALPPRLAWSFCAGMVLAMPWIYLGAAASPWVPLALAGVALPFWCLALAWICRYERNGHALCLSSGALILIGALLLLPTYAALLGLRTGPHGAGALIFLLALVWGADIAAYFAGRRFGRHKLAPRVSPGKTWEGAAGAALATCLLTFFWILWRGEPWGRAPTLLVFFLGTMAWSVVGDLLESLFKRQRGCKDSGTLLPGHGGVMDRIDSLTAAAPIFLLCLYALEP
jgi:phosphatidate cytidylyltransferase